MGKDWMKNRQILRGRRYESEIQEARRELSDRMTGERVRKVGLVCINREEFRHTELEKIRLKEAKADSKRDQLRRRLFANKEKRV
jgi:hypothetical protein